MSHQDVAICERKQGAAHLETEWRAGIEWQRANTHLPQREPFAESAQFGAERGNHSIAKSITGRIQSSGWKG
jgi:hypothetical protein